MFVALHANVDGKIDTKRKDADTKWIPNCRQALLHLRSHVDTKS